MDETSRLMDEATRLYTRRISQRMVDAYFNRVISEALADKNGPVEGHFASAVAPRYIKKVYKVADNG